MISPLRFPTELHQEVAELAEDFFSAHAHVDTILVVNSCARGRAVAGSDLDLAVLITPAAAGQAVQSLETMWQEFSVTHPLIRQFRNSGRFTQVHVDVFDGRMIQTVWDDGGGPDNFEVEIGNRLAYAAPLREAGAYFRQLQSQWLPYYEEELRLSRLVMVREACARDLEAIPFYLGRGLYFQAFDRLYKAFREFLQALFVARRTYPLCYNKWIQEQVIEWLSLPELYKELPPILSVRKIESAEVGEKAEALRTLLERWTRPEPHGHETAQPSAAHVMDEKPHQPKPKADMPPPRKPPGRSAIAGAGDDKPKEPEIVRITLPPKPTAAPTVRLPTLQPPTDSTT